MLPEISMSQAITAPYFVPQNRVNPSGESVIAFPLTSGDNSASLTFPVHGFQIPIQRSGLTESCPTKATNSVASERIKRSTLLPTSILQSRDDKIVWRLGYPGYPGNLNDSHKPQHHRPTGRTRNSKKVVHDHRPRRRSLQPIRQIRLCEMDEFPSWTVHQQLRHHSRP